MFLTDGQSNYDRVRDDLFARVRDTGASANASFLGGTIRGDKVYVPLFGQEWRGENDAVYRDGLKLDTIGSILIARYLLQGGTAEIPGTWVPYRDLKDGAQFSSYIKTHLEERIARTFSGKTDALRTRLEASGARPYEGEFF